jgi:hypothetical protein
MIPSFLTYKFITLIYKMMVKLPKSDGANPSYKKENQKRKNRKHTHCPLMRITI